MSARRTAMGLGLYCACQIEADGLGQEPVLHLADARVERFRGVVRLDPNPLLSDDRPCVDAVVEEVDRDAGLLGAGREGLADRVEPRKRRQERRVDVEARESAEEA